MGILSELLLMHAASPTHSRSAYATGVGNPHSDIDDLDDRDHPTPLPQCHQYDSAFFRDRELQWCSTNRYQIVGLLLAEVLSGAD
jgi:hypothetical protein